jgi:hypothetical protein
MPWKKVERDLAQRSSWYAMRTVFDFIINSSSVYVARIGLSPLLKEENAVPMKEEKRIPAGTNWAKITMTPPVKKKQTPNRPIPLIPPA